MNLRLIRPTAAYRRQITEMLDEWFAAEKPEDVTPWAITKNDYHDFAFYVSHLDVPEGHPTLVPDTTLFCYDADADRCVGAVNIRHRLNEKLLQSGGHIGDGVRPSLRGRGVGTSMVALALEKCREMGISRVLMVCEKDNLPSAATILRNGGVLENEIEQDGCVLQRYWIDLAGEEKENSPNM